MGEMLAERAIVLPEEVTTRDSLELQYKHYRPFFRDPSGELIIQMPISKEEAKAILQAPGIIVRELADLAKPIVVPVAPIALLVAASYLPELLANKL